MHPFARSAGVVHLTALGLWAGVVAMTGAAAAVTFPTIKSLHPILPNLTKDADSHWLLVGGKAVSSIFHTSHVAQSILAVLAIASLWGLLVTEAAPKARCRLVWLVAEGGAIVVFGYYIFVLWPRMDKNLSSYWDSTFTDKPGAAELAAQSQAAFRADHPLSSNLLGTLLVLLLVALLSAAWTLLSRKSTP